MGTTVTSSVQGWGQALGWFGQTDDLALYSSPAGTGPPCEVATTDLSPLLARAGG